MSFKRIFDRFFTLKQTNIKKLATFHVIASKQSLRGNLSHANPSAKKYRKKFALFFLKLFLQLNIHCFYSKNQVSHTFKELPSTNDRLPRVLKNSRNDKCGGKTSHTFKELPTTSDRLPRKPCLLAMTNAGAKHHTHYFTLPATSDRLPRLIL